MRPLVYVLIFLGGFFSLRSHAQTVQWASQVIGASSEGKGDSYGQQFKAVQALGKPNKLPDLGYSPCAWSPLYPDGAEEWLHVGFEKAMPVRQVIVGENVNPGAVVRVVVYDERGTEHVVYTASPQARPEGTLRIMVKDTGLVGNAVKITLATAAIKGPNQIDAVGLSDSPKPVPVEVAVSKGTPKEIQKENLGKTVNSAGQEVAPVIAPDGKTLYFTRAGHKGNTGQPEKQDIWVSTLQSAGPGQPPTWSEAVNIGSPINNVGDNAISGISSDGRILYLINVYRPDGGLFYGLSKSQKTKAGWSFPIECKMADNRNYHKDDKLEFSVSPDGKVIVLAMQKKDSMGDRDLYVSFLNEDQTWSAPKHMGRVINSADSEASPFIAADGRTLYFSSEGHPGFGNGDIFVTRRLDDSWQVWSEPENLGPAINTPKWDGYFTIPASGEYAYLSSGSNSLGMEDIFRLKLFPSIKPDPVAIVSGQVLDAQSKKPVPSDVVSGLFGEKDKEISRVEYDPETGEYKMILPTQKTYNLTASKEGYFPATEVLDLSRDKRFRDIRRNLYLIPIQPGQKIVMREVLFEQGKADLQPGADGELDKVVRMLTQYPGMELLVEGHTDNQGEWEPNMKLSEDRVETVKCYLEEKGIAYTRVQTKAWGPSKPIASNETEEKRKQNRRVEFTILKM
ncbi:OmpA family protein [Rudanella paleaurantiibacter]|uniref:OmpA family protein n=1 Tax=Rudanella paleaurantiibacter TaxID=2614655 RepID=A0A7J5TXR5_9BACT|nr:OmpA family protein [Rudanella paleaurantiibacter]KAB7729939.1 OmpA family protein [Rudanella paleaurantiibacter]